MNAHALIEQIPELPRRVRNICWIEGIRTLGDLALIPDADLLRLPNMGPRSLLAIQVVLKDADLLGTRRTVPIQRQIEHHEREIGRLKKQLADIARGTAER